VGVRFFREGTVVESGLGGRLDIRPSPRGGCGKEFMLTVFLIDLPAALTPETDLGWGWDPVATGDAGGRRLPDGARRPVLGVAGVDLLKGAARFPVLFLVLLMGNAGSAIVGGPFEGRAGLGRAVDILATSSMGFWSPSKVQTKVRQRLAALK
jgi:hypothetical protein